MDLESLMHRYFRLKQDLAIAYRAQPWNSTRIDRLADDLADTERWIASLHPHRTLDTSASASRAQAG